MTEERLKDLAQRLHEELEQTETLGTESRQALGTVLSDITRLREQPAEKPESGLIERIREAGSSLEAAHPRLAAALEELGNVLNTMGI